MSGVLRGRVLPITWFRSHNPGTYPQPYTWIKQQAQSDQVVKGHTPGKDPKVHSFLIQSPRFPGRGMDSWGQPSSG